MDKMLAYIILKYLFTYDDVLKLCSDDKNFEYLAPYCLPQIVKHNLALQASERILYNHPQLIHHLPFLARGQPFQSLLLGLAVKANHRNAINIYLEKETFSLETVCAAMCEMDKHDLLKWIIEDRISEKLAENLLERFHCDEMIFDILSPFLSHLSLENIKTKAMSSRSSHVLEYKLPCDC